jgi:ABC-type multidrug transport system fused ATPase/permease subunit
LDKSGLSVNKSFQLLKRILKNGKSYIPSFLLLGGIGLVLLPLELYGLMLSRKLIDKGLLLHDWDVIQHILLILAGLFVIRSFASYGTAVFSTKLQLRVNQKFQDHLFSHVMHLPMRYLARQSTGQLMSRVLDDGTRFAAFFDLLFGRAVLEPLKLLVLMALLAYFNVRLSAIMFCSTIASFIVIYLMGNKLHLVSKEIQKKNASLYGFVEQMLSNVELVKSKVAEKKTARNFREQLDNLIHLLLNSLKISLVARPILQILKYLTLGTVFFYGGWLISSNSLTIGTLTIFLGATYLFFNTLDSIGQTYGLLRENLARMEIIYSIFDSPTERYEITAQVKIPPSINMVEFNNVTFGYNASIPVLKDVSFGIAAGGVFGITGQSGSGKTTLIRLLVRFYEQDKGTIRLNDQSIQQFDLTALRASIGIVFQENLILNDTLRNNIAYGSLSLSDVQIIRSAKLSGAHDFIKLLPRRYETVVGEGGRLLSGGERQRLSIARAIVTAPEILILDEGTSYLEVEQESMILQNIKEQRINKITIVVSHRLSAMKIADRILTIDNGRVVETDFQALATTMKGH